MTSIPLLDKQFADLDRAWEPSTRPEENSAMPNTIILKMMVVRLIAETDVIILTNAASTSVLLITLV